MIKRQGDSSGQIPREVKPGHKGEVSFDLHPGTAKCETCGNDYDKPLEIVVNGISHYFDSFECAIHQLAPKCAHCSCKIIGHGVEAGGTMFCCAHCAKHAGVETIKDRA